MSAKPETIAERAARCSCGAAVGHSSGISLMVYFDGHGGVEGYQWVREEQEQ